VAARIAGGKAPTRRSFLAIDRHAGGAVVSALKKADDRDSIVVRLFNPADEDAEATIRVDGTVSQAFAVNFLEERQQELRAESGGVRVRLGPHQIQTIELLS
jgi:alpha-mannosidase